MKYTLYIDGSRVETDASSLILYNYTRDEASNPTVVKNSYSQKVTVPGTSANNAIFSHFYRSDYATGTGRFNPISKTPFEIRNEMSEIVESGYVKMESVERKGADTVSYTITLIGGLGGFFYGLTYDDDGEDLTLADLTFYTDDGNKAPSEISYPATAATVNSNWGELEINGGYGDKNFSSRHLVNNAPCNNGLPGCKFETKKFVYKGPTSGSGPSLPNITNTATSEGVTYGPKGTADGYIMLQTSASFTEWEVQDLRAYLQRPVISVKGLLDTIAMSANTGDYTLVLDSNVFNSSNKWYYYGWMTLAAFDRDNVDPTTAHLSDILEDTKSPAAYLLGFAKMFGLVFLYDGVTKTVTLTSRDIYYGNATPVDISGRIDTSSIKAVPTNISKRWYVFQDTMADADFTDAYAEKYEKEYGAQWVDTGYQFNDEKSELLEKSPFKGAADVLEQSGAYFTDATGNVSPYSLKFKFDLLEEVKWDLYSADGTQTLNLSSYRGYSGYKTWYRYSSSGYTKNGIMPMPQFHDDSNKTKDCSGVLLFYNGTIITTQTGMRNLPFYLTDDVPAMTELAENPCWIATGVLQSTSDPSSWGIPYVLTRIPSFRRWAFDADGDMELSMDFGNVQETAVPETFVSGCGVYHKFWQKYIQDRCHVDTRTVTCKVDFSGMRVNADTLRRFYWFDNALWALNKIKNYCMTKTALTECEFIKVQDIDNYNNGQII